jgi:cytoskeleton protein RodZ
MSNGAGEPEERPAEEESIGSAPAEGETASEGEPVAQEAPRPGAVLMAERRSQGLSLGDIARQLKLSVRQVEALEQDDYSAFPGPVFVRGFLRNYAKFLRLDPEAVAAMAQLPSSMAIPSLAEPAGSPQEVRRSGRSGMAIGAVVLIVLIALVLVLRGGRDKSPRMPAVSTPGMPSVAVSPQPDSPPPGSAPGTAATTPMPGSAPTTATAPEPGPASPVSAAATSSVVPAGAAGDAAAGTPAVRESKPVSVSAAPVKTALRLSFDDESWVEVKDGAGNVIFSQLNRPGSERVVTGAPPLSVVIGNAHGVKLSYRGKVVDLGPHTRVDVARVVLE